MMSAMAVVGCAGCAGRQSDNPPKIEPVAQPQVQAAPAVPATAPAPTPTAVPAVAPVAAKPAPVAPKPPLPAPQPQAPALLATIDDLKISRAMVEKLTMDSHGLNMLLRVAQVEMAKAAAEKAKIQVTPADIAAERASTLDKWFKDTNPKLSEELNDAENRKDQALVEKLQAEMRKDYEAMLQQSLTRQNMTMTEFDLLMQANTYIRKVVEKATEGKITEDNVKEGFNALYGENVRVRHIQCTNMVEVAEAQRRLATGESFESVATALSRNGQTAPLGGELPPFSRQTPNLPDMFKQVAFSLDKVGDVSDPVEANGNYHLIKLMEHIAPKAVKYEDVKDYVREQLRDRWVIERMKVYRDDLAKKALEGLKIEDPVLAKQFADRVARRESELKERDQISRELARERSQMGQDKADATTKPAEELRPPATQSGSDTPDQK